ncbi:14298_t:CDS:2 [Rhizophagus irregularis]|nr:14298_t:CDS:2 [Rhizophagus irregularis]
MSYKLHSKNSLPNIRTKKSIVNIKPIITTNSTNSSKSLPAECLQHIFAHLSYSKSSLHSCLLVNRLWCVNVVKVLWSQPFHLLNICPSSTSPFGVQGQCNRTTKDTYIQCAALINVYLSFLDRDEKSNLLNNRIKLNSSKIKDKDNSNQYFLENPTFNYIEFLRYLDLEELFITKTLKKAVNTLTKKSSLIISVDGFPVAVDRVVSYSLAKLIMSKCKQLKSLSIDTRLSSYPCHCLNVPEEHLLIATYSGANKCLPPLTEFICTTRGTKWRLFHALAGTCKHLKKIVVDMGGYTACNAPSSTNQSQRSTGIITLLTLVPYTEPQMQELEWEAKNLATLLQSQNSLESFTLLRGEIGLLTILGALKSQVNTLKHLEFVQLNTKYAQWGAFYNILEYIKLKELVFRECELSDDLMRPLITPTNSKRDLFKSIEVLNFEKSIVSNDSIEKLIIETGPNLKKLILGNNLSNVSSKSFTTTDTISLIEIVGQHCPNLTHFTTFVDTNDVPQLITLFTLCPLLRSIELSRNISPQDESLEDAVNHTADITYLLEQITSQNLLSNLNRLILSVPWSFTSTSLENYLLYVRPPLNYLEVRQSYSFNSDHLEILVKYAKERQRLKRVYIETLNELSEEVLAESEATFELFEYQRIRSGSHYYIPGYGLLSDNCIKK